MRILRALIFRTAARSRFECKTAAGTRRFGWGMGRVVKCSEPARRFLKEMTAAGELSMWLKCIFGRFLRLFAEYLSVLAQALNRNQERQRQGLRTLGLGLILEKGELRL